MNVLKKPLGWIIRKFLILINDIAYNNKSQIIIKGLQIYPVYFTILKGNEKVFNIRQGKTYMNQYKLLEGKW